MLISKLEKTKSPEEKTKIMKVMKVNVSNLDETSFANLIFFSHDHLFEMYKIYIYTCTLML